VLWIRIGFNADSNPDPAFKENADPYFKTKNCNSLQLEKILIFFQNCNLFNPRPSLWTSKLKKKPSALIREYPAFQNTKFLKFFLF
jgi:hypothetical protein